METHAADMERPAPLERDGSDEKGNSVDTSLLFGRANDKPELYQLRELYWRFRRLQATYDELSQDIYSKPTATVYNQGKASGYKSAAEAVARMVAEAGEDE